MLKRKRRTYHHGDLRDALISLALETLEKSGPEELTLRGLAERAGVSGMAPYRHFADKTALLRAVAAHGFAILKEDFKAVDDPANPRRAIEAFGLAYARFVLERPGLFRLMFDGPPLLSVEEMDADPDNSYNLLGQRLAQVVPAARRRIAAVAFQSIVHGFCVLLANHRLRRLGSVDPRDIVPEFTSILLGGLSRSS
jgi:AcrR family transcriptional regulator